ncbi:hypothetical protein BFR04_02950 [Gaetbulibacter sp. 4G1]|nr:hypothetical protein BFR04_02950 [Gaetbulibacter sp. 4G1]
MKKSILNFGRVLTKAEQKSINGGNGGCWNLGNPCSGHYECGSMTCDLRCEAPLGTYICVPA